MKKNVCDCTPLCIGMKKIIIGIIVLLNVKYAWLDWASFIGWLLIVVGIIKMIKPECPCCNK